MKEDSQSKKEEKKREIEKLKEEIERLKKERDEYLKGWQRARADYLNYLKEEKERLKEFLEIANQELIVKLLPILDSFERAKESIPQDLKGNQIIEGFFQIQSQLNEILKNEGLEEIEVKIGEEFNPEIHEAVGEIEKEDVPPNHIAEILEKGYKFKGKILRPVKVKISTSKVEKK